VLGARRVVLAGGILLPIALGANGLAHSQWHLYVTHGILAALGVSATGYVPVSLVLTRRFREHRGFALGTASAGVGIGILLFVPLTQVFIDCWGWRIAYFALGAIGASIALPVGFFALRDGDWVPPEESQPRTAAGTLDQIPRAGPEWTLASALCSREFWLVTATFVLLNCPTQLVLTHHVAHLVEVGHSNKMLVAGVVGLVGLFSIPGKIGWGFLSDWWWPEWIYVMGAGCLIVAILSLLAIDPASSTWSLYGYAVLMGFGYAVSPAMTPILTGRFFVGRHFGIILGALNTFYQGAGAVGIALAGYAHDMTGSYRVALLGSILCAAAAVGCVWAAAPRRYQPPRPMAPTG
jgi:predicted MFS family arabinose efflux permease